ncbi:hypothetical protein J4E89_000018 [Alternaria sp. Ai002NY15]|nr:hypothetical protein J4E89_000018 [Alternaria sp. Ai002NY15]
MSKFKSPTDTQYVMMKNTISALVRKATSNEEETVDTKIENNHLRSEETNFDGHTRQTPMTGDITATASSAVSRDIWSSSYGRDTIGISTVPTSIDPGGDQEVGGVSPTDDASIYTSNIPEASAYAQELATSFFGISEPLPDLKYLERIHEVLPNLLRGFALKIGAESQSPEHFEIMKFIHGIRGLITSRFEEYYLDDHTNLENQQRRTLDGMVLDEKLERWQVDPMADVPDILPDMQQYFDDEGDDVDLEGANSGVYDLRLAMYRNAITTSTAFQWLVRRVDRETSLTTSEANKMHAIASQIRQALYAQRQNRVISSLNGPPKCSMVFKSNWNPLAFVSQQEYAEEPDDAIEGAIVIVQGVNGDTETMSCAEYLGRTWPLLGENLMALVRHVVMGEPGLRYSSQSTVQNLFGMSAKPCVVKLFDSTMITAWFEPSGCFSVEASGVVETIVEVGEVYGWMTAALRSSPTDRITAITPILEISAETNGKSFRADFIQEHSDIFLCSTGQCWQNLFWNPVVVTGFPVRRRESGQEPGLECSLGMLTALLRSRNLAAFGNTVFVKGFCTMLVPTKYSNGTVHWHVLFNEDGSRISYTDPRVREVVGDFDLMKHLTLSGISSARHIVGWCELARNNAGTKEANYLIDRTRLEGPGSQFAFDRITFSGGKFVPVAVSAAIGKKDKPVRVQKTSEYYKQLEWAERRFVVFYEPEDRRAWLVDGLSALLHLVRAHVAHRRAKGREVIFGDKEIKEANPAHTGKTAADTFLRNKGNMDLRIYERWNRPVIETSTEGSDEPKSTVKRHQTFEHLVDLVGDIFGILSAAFDLQEDALRADGFGARVRTSTRRHLVGWDFMEVATLEESLWPKSVALLDTGIGWVDLARSIQAVTLFGVGFGEIVQPTATAQPGGESSAKGRVGEGQDGVAVPAATRPLSHRSEGEFSADAIDPVSGRNNDLQAASAIEGSDAGSNALVGYICTRWPILPKGKDLLATTTAVIKDIRESAYKGSPAANNRFWLTRNLYWHVPDKIFEKCHCGKAKPCDRVQVLLPTNFPNIFARALRSPDEPFPLHGAMIFGHSWKFPLRWPSNAESIPEEELAEQPQLLLESSQGLHMATPSDSGLGTSVSSSARGNASSQVAVTATAKEFAGIYRGKQYHEPDFDAVLDRALAAGVEKVMLTGMYASDASFNLGIARKRPEQCRVTIGVHPYHAVEADEGGEEYYKSLSDSITTTMTEEPHLLAAFGELGLDYDKLAEAPKDVQIRVFKHQLDMIVSAGWELPLFLHCRAAFEDFVAILEPYMDRLPLRSGLVHSFVGTTAQMQTLNGMGLHVSVNNFAFRDRDSLDMIRHVPLDKLQIETDAPWGDIQASSEVAKAYLKNATKWSWGSKKKDKFTLGDMVKERNESCNVEKVALVVAGIKGVGVEEVAESAWRNSVDMFFSR